VQWHALQLTLSRAYNISARTEVETPRFQQQLYCCVRIRCRGNVFTKPLLRNGYLQSHRVATGQYATVCLSCRYYILVRMLVTESGSNRIKNCFNELVIFNEVCFAGKKCYTLRYIIGLHLTKYKENKLRLLAT
jgi:hypothetical protein